jgi:hypothetical protein
MTKSFPVWLQLPVAAAVQAYIDHGWKVIPIPPGTKGPHTTRWNRPGAHLKTAADMRPGHGVGLCHAYSGTMALDIDSPDAFHLLQAEGIDLQAMLDAPDAVQIKSHRPGSHKLLFKLPEGLSPTTIKVKHNGACAYELRHGTDDGLTVQDVLPPTIHPDTLKPYQWAGAGDWRNPPVIPEALVRHWMDLIASRAANSASKAANSASALPCSEGVWERSKEAMNALDPNMPHDEWIKAGTALKDTGHPEAFDVFDTWSAKATRPGAYRGTRHVMSQWASFDTSRVGLDSLFFMAREAGWIDRPDVTGMFAPVQSTPAGAGHPLTVRSIPWTKRVAPELKPLAQEFVIAGLIQTGVVLIAGWRGIGKSVNILSLYLAGVCGIGAPGSSLLATRPRKLVWITEDWSQTYRTVRAVMAQGWADEATINDRLIVVEAERIRPQQIADAVPFINSHVVTHDGVTLTPCVVLDTKAACFDIEDENSNAENSAVIASCRATGLDVTVIAHTAKSISRSTDPNSMSARGAGSQEADVSQTAYLVEDGGVRYLLLGKKRFEMPSGTDEVIFEPVTCTEFARDRWGGIHPQTLRCAIAKLTSSGQRAATAEAVKTEKIDEALVDAVRQVQNAGGVVSRSKLQALVDVGRKQTRLARINHLIVAKVLETYVGDLEQYEAAEIKEGTLLLRLTAGGINA